MPATTTSIASLQRKIWTGSLPLEIRLAAADCRTYDDSDPYLIHYPRLSYLSFLLLRLHAFFASSLIHPNASPYDAWLSFQGVPLKWHYPAGLLYDLYSGAQPVNIGSGRTMSRSMEDSQIVEQEDGKEQPLPWRLTIHFTDFPAEQLIQLDAEGKTMLDMYVNSVKEADFIRNGTARTVMSLSKEDSDALWRSVQTHDISLFNSINNKLLNPPGSSLRHIPAKIYLPTSASKPSASSPIPEETSASQEGVPQAGHIRVVQSLVPLQLPSKQTQTLGTALNSILPTVFPSRRNPLLAQPVLHGAVVPMGAGFEELGRAAAYSDGFLHLAVVMLA